MTQALPDSLPKLQVQEVYPRWPDFRRTMRDNLTVFDGKKRGFYEVYYLKVNLLRAGKAFWIRYTIHSPRQASQPISASVWALVFDADGGNHLAFKQDFPWEACQVRRDRPRLSIKDNFIAHTGCYGRIEQEGHQMEWTLEWNPNVKSHRYFPSSLFYVLPVPKTKVVCPNMDIYLHGRVVLDGEAIEFDGEPGQQNHIWGSEHAKTWAWTHCNSFVRHPLATMEAIQAQPRSGPGACLFYFEQEGRRFELTRWMDLLRNRMTYTPEGASFAGQIGDRRFEGTVKVAKEDVIGVTYHDPSGEKLYCYHTELADAEVVVCHKKGKRFEPLERWEARRSCAFEWGTREANPAFKLYV